MEVSIILRYWSTEGKVVTVSADNTENLSYKWGYLSDGNSGTEILLDCTSDKCTINDVQKYREYFCKVTDCYENETDVWFHVGVENQWLH